MNGHDMDFTALFDGIDTQDALHRAVLDAEQQLGVAPRDMDFLGLVAERSDSDELLQRDFELSYSVWHARCYQRIPTITALAERANITTHPAFVAAAARVLRGAQDG